MAVALREMHRYRFAKDGLRWLEEDGRWIHVDDLNAALELPS
jgi:hypothetical protein